MVEHPIIFQGWGIRAVRAGTKTQTRRIVIPQLQKGMTLWTRETFHQHKDRSITYRADMDSEGLFWHLRNDGCAYEYEVEKWTPSIFMPRWASRDNLTVKSVRVERVQDISADDCQDEGIERIDRAEYDYDSDGAPNNKYWVMDDEAMIESFAALWDSINAKPRARMRGGEIAFYESFPWDGERRTEQYHGKPHHIHPNSHVWRIEFERASI